ncbi:DNA polymerase III, clamp loader complex, gamma/delta/delta subunit [Spinellus fusiger]|nr:DNA polymerase III, clamp loader complex, gamma/delta/delta subunit [Spinellus fusiger]
MSIVRPVSLSQVIGQDELVGDQSALRKLIQKDTLPSMILWGPPGCGKTTLARIISKTTKHKFIELSATQIGTAEIKKTLEDAQRYEKLTSHHTIVFVDEMHRLTRAQQDMFLPLVEKGTVCWIGATTENPSFKVNSALLSRCRVFVLQQLSQEHIVTIVERAIVQWRMEHDSCLETPLESENEVIRMLALRSDGDARYALNTLEVMLAISPSKDTPLATKTLQDALQRANVSYDKNGEEHYNIISALHKSVRGSDANAALYWLGRMLEAGEDPLYVARRLIRMASEDIGLADNAALGLAVSAYQACEKIGMPECDTVLAHTVTYLAEAKKSVRTYKAYNLVKQTLQNEPNYSVPFHIRNAPTQLMKNMGYGAGYKYNPDYTEPVEQTYLPDALVTRQFLDPRASQ